MKKLLLFLGFVVSCFSQGSVIPTCDQQSTQHCIYWTMPSTLSADVTSQSYTPWTYQGFVVNGLALGNLDTSPGIHIFAGPTASVGTIEDYQSTGVFGALLLNAGEVKLEDAGGGGQITIQMGGNITIIPDVGNVILLGSTILQVDKLGNISDSGTGALWQLTSSTAGIDLTAATAHNAIQVPLGGVTAEMVTDNGEYIGQTGSSFGSVGGYFEIALLSYPPVSSGPCSDVWGNVVTFPTPTPQESSGFGIQNEVMWQGPSPLYGAVPSNCGPSPFKLWGGGTVNTSGTSVTWVSGSTFNSIWAGTIIQINGVLYGISTVNSTTSITLTTSAGTQSGVWYSAGDQQQINGLNFNAYIGSLEGVASFSSAYNSIQSVTGGVVAGTTVLAGQPYLSQGYSASTGFPSIGSLGNYVATVSYSSAGSGSVTGATGTFCAVSMSGPSDGGGYGAQALLTLAGTNTLSGATMTLVNPSSGVIQGGQLYSSTPTTGVLNNGNQVPWPGHAPAVCTGTINISSTILPIYYGGLNYKSGNVYWYYNSATATWATVDFSAVGTNYWTLSGSILYPSSGTTYSVLVGAISTDLSIGNADLVARGSLASITAASNASVASLAAVSGSYVSLSSNHTGSGTTLPLTVFIGSNQPIFMPTGGSQLYVNRITDDGSSTNLEINGSMNLSGNYYQGGNVAINSSNQFIGAAVNVTGVVESQISSSSDAFLLSNLDFVVTGLGFVQTTNSFNTTVGTYEVGGSTAINSSNQFVGAAVNVTGAVESQVSTSSDAFLTSNLDFQVTGQGFVQTTNFFNATSTGGYELNGTVFFNSGGFYDPYFSGNSTSVSCSSVNNGWLGTLGGDQYLVVCIGGNRYRVAVTSY